MKITSIELHPANSSQVFTFSFRDPTRQNPYNVKSIIGLDAEDIISRYYGSAINTLDNFFNMALQKREPVMRVELNPQFGAGKSFSDLRDDLYKMIASSRTGLIQIRFLNGTDVVAAISASVSKFEAAHFDKSPDVQITFKANDPILRALTATVIDVSGLDPAATNIQDLVSTSPHGFDFAVNVLDTIPSLRIADPLDASWQFTVFPAGGFLAGDVIHCSSEINKKQLYVVRAGVTTYLADTILSGSVWPIIFPGPNNFVFDNPSKVSWASLSYYHTYWGV